jgi:SAM-dependent methyltransferase
MTSRGSTSGLIGDRLRAGLREPPPRRPGAESSIVEAISADLAVMTEHARFVEIVPAPSNRLVARLARPIQRVLLRLLGPLTFAESEFAAATIRAVAALQDVVAAQQELLDSAAEGRESRAEAALLDVYALEERFRGTEDAVRERQARFVPYFEGASGAVLDLGCGRGEFLGLLRSANVEAYGVDRDEAMIRHCQRLGHAVVEDDAVAHIEAVAPGTIGGVFCAHLIEHLVPARALRLVRGAYAALAPGGWFVLETPNPETLLALSAFYTNFTHVKPYHPRALEWLLTHLGFENVALTFSDPVDDRKLPALHNTDAADFNAALMNLNDLLFGDLDFAVAGQKPPQ